ncbi:sensor histidine kinase [Pseudoxanthomonas sacheonensis]|uniref:Signal transduction histidine kinase/ligand-binding sensor domain-containing protein n=1 Tax=Pseudoxanthomonas sacheonensis TaxID=443615 RepID=A0ABU1RTN7_9GAMM|nr:two-component regulator propeller domain-containing protein [Pseudoxanthomonas sacheonensis]MDR6842133.1 signal transduction histidine kinase/ligand-binding sensor domain-containing protein [Pseudoxanthomonas sacheonensis]
MLAEAEKRVKATVWLFRTLLFAVLTALSLATSAEEPRRLAHYSHQRWIEGSEAPAPVLAMAQGRDGFLWLATGEGLFRFDGVRFERVEPEGSDQKHDQPSALLVTKSGDVWTNFETSRRFAVYRHSALRILDAPAAPSRIVAMAEGADGAIWALTENYDAEVLRFHNGRWRTFNAADGLPQINAANLLVAADGAVWIACSTGVARLPPGAARFEIYRKALDTRVSQDPAGRIWLSERRGSYPITGPGGRGSPQPLSAPYGTGNVQIRGAPLLDREGNLWIATRYDGVQRFAAPRVSSGSGGTETESFTGRDGLSSNVTNQVLEDREGNIWVGTERGLDKFRPATLIAEPALVSPATYGDKLLTASDGSIYIGQARTLYRVRPGETPEPLLRDVADPQSLCEAPDGALWIGLPTQILVWTGGGVRRTIERPDKDANHNIIYDCAFDAHGDYWISAAGGGVRRYRHGRWELVLEPGDRADFFPTTMIRTPQGGVVVQTGDRLVWIEDSGRSFTRLDFGASGIKVLTLYSAGDDVFAAGAFGLSRFRAGHAETVRATEVSPGSRINGMVRTPEGDTWLAYPRSLVRIKSRELERAFSDKEFSAPTLSLGLGDGLTSRPHSHSQRSMVRGGDGRLWIATETGTLWMDPARIVRNALPPSLAIKSINGDGRVHRDPTALKLSAATANIEIDFSVLSFADPGRVRARYMLEGFDRDWVDPGTRRQAFYTNLPPGKYRFHVIAANNDGVWNRTGATLDFEIPPTFIQSVWFLLLCSGLALASLWFLYRLRVAQIAHRIRSRLEERISERERIARELHDTLLQGVQGLILRFQAVADRIPVEEKSREQLEEALAAADDVVVDARNRVHDLRGIEGTGDLCAIIEQLVAAAPFDPPIPVRIVVEGKPRPLHPLVAAEVTRIVREALFNIAHHARASSAEVAIDFETRHLAIRVRDDGVGIPEHVLARGHKEGHFGMIGMRERAERIGGGITISGSPGDGSEITLTLPAELAFAKRRARRRVRLPRFLHRSPSDE